MNHNKNKNQSNQNKGNQLNAYAKYSSVVIQMMAIIGIGTFAGVKLDDSFPNQHDLYTIILSLSSVIISIVFVIRRIIAISKDS